MTPAYPTLRLRRLRQNPVLREIIRETELNLNDLIFPLFIKDMKGPKCPIKSMPGHFQIPVHLLEEEIEELLNLNISSLLLFGIPSHKDSRGSDSYSDSGVIQQAIKAVRGVSQEILIIADSCFCGYTDHGHCGILHEKKGKVDVDNDQTLALLAKQAISYAEAGADVIAPSGMMDGMVRAIRTGLDGAGFECIPILSYSVKYNSSMYGPFRMAAEGSPSFGDRSTHQMDCSNAKEAIREVQLDIAEGVDMLMVKPAHTYLDVIHRIKRAYPYVPLGAYHTSGEYSMLKAAAQNGWIDEKRASLEVLKSIRRAGADFIITYYAKEMAQQGLLK